MKNSDSNQSLFVLVKRNVHVMLFLLLSSPMIYAQYTPGTAVDINGCSYANLGDAGATTAPANVPPPNCATNNGAADVIWNTYTVTGPIQLTASGAGMPGALTDIGMAVYTFDGTNYILEACNDDAGVGLYPMIEINQDLSTQAPDVMNIAIGTVLYISTWDYSNNNDGPYVVQTSGCGTPTIYYVDNDGDGYGDESSPSCDCSGTPPANSVTQGGDCNDNCDIVWEGLACDDGDPNTIGDVIVDPTCTCSGSVPVTNPCIPAGAENYTFTPATALTAPVIGSNVQICYSIDWSQASGSWMDGIQFQLGPGFTNIVGVSGPANCSAFGGGNWVYSTTINPSSTCALPINDDLSATNNTVGYYYDAGSGNPANNFGDPGSCIFTACISATINSVNVADLTIDTYASGDDYFGSYTVCGPCQPQAYSYPSAGTGVGNCNLQLSACITPTDCDQNTGLITIDQSNLNYASFYNAPSSGNLIVQVNGNTVQTIPAPFSASPTPLNFTMYANGVSPNTATNTVTAYFDQLPTCTATSTLISPPACGCMVNIQDVLMSCQPTPTPAPIPAPDPLNQFMDIGLDLSVNALPIGSTLSISYGNPLNDIDLTIANANIMTTINNGPNPSTPYWNFGTFGPLSTDGLLALFPNGILPLTITLTDAGGNDLSPTCTLPPAQNIVIPQLELISPVVANCSSTAQGSAFDVALTANILGFDEMSANNILSFFNNGIPVAVAVNGNPAANTFDLTTLPAGTSSIDLVYSNIIYNDPNGLTFSLSNGTCNFDALVNETDPATPAVLTNAFNFVVNNTAGNPFSQDPCTCQITNLQVTNATPDCIGYGNFFELEVSFDFAYPPNGLDAHIYYTSTLDTVANPVFTKNTLNFYDNFSTNFTNGNFPSLSFFKQIPTPPAGVGLTEPYTNNLVVDFEYPTGSGLNCSAVIPFTLPGACNCNIVDMGTYSPAESPAANATQLVLCPNESVDFTSNNNFTPPAIAFQEIAPDDYQPLPDERALGLILVDPATGQQILWGYQTIDFSGATPTINGPLSIENTYDVTNDNYTVQDQIINLLNSSNDPLEEPLILNARIVTIYNISNLLGAGGTVPMLIPGSEINPADPNMPYSGNVFATGVGPLGGNLICGGFTNDWELVFTPIIEVENIVPNCPDSTITFDVHSGSYATLADGITPFDWSTPALNSAVGPGVTANATSNASPANFTYDNLTNNYVLNLTFVDPYGCQMTQTFAPFIAETIGQISWNEIGGTTAILPTSPNQMIRCGTDPDFQLVGQGEGSNTNPQAGQWEIIWNGSTFTNPLTPYFNPGTGNLGPAAAIDFNQLYTDLQNDGLLNPNTTLFPANQSLYFSLRFKPTITSPGCSDWSDEYQIAFLDNYIPQAVLTPAGTSAVSKCLNEAQFDLSAIGGLPLNGVWHIGPIDPLTNTGAQDNIISGGSTFDLPNVPSPGIYEAYYDVAGVVGVQCPVLSNDFITITVHDTTDALVTANFLEACMPHGDFVLTNESDLINGTTNCEWYVDDVLQTNGDCNSIDLTLMMPKLYDITLIFTDFNGCTTTRRYEDTLEVHPQPEVSFIYNPESVTMDDPEFQFLDNSASPLVSFDWNFANYGSSNEQYTTYNFSEVTEPGSYDVVLVGTDANQCSTEVTRQVMIEEGFIVFMPTSFTPDDDNLNEALRPVISGSDRIRFYKFVVFDRWGNTVFETNDYKQWWIGDNAAAAGYYVPNGAYQWRMEVILEGLEDRKIYTGSVTIIR
jgi:hypothetical protein